MSKFIDHTGEILTSSKGEEFVIIKYTNANDVDVLFKNNVIIKGRSYDSLKKGSISNPYHPSLYGVGYIGEGFFKSCCYENKHTKHYSLWKSMLRRCYVNKQKDIQPSYRICTADEHWHNFQNFAEWFDENWKPYMEGWHLDKDILQKSNKVYSPETCCFVPQEINKLFTKRKTKRGKYPIGVVKVGNKFQAQISLRGNYVYLGIFDTIELAFQVYKTAKEGYIKEIADEWKNLIDTRVYDAIYNYQVEITD